VTARPTKKRALVAVKDFLFDELGVAVAELPHIHLLEDGPDSWAFWILDDDTVSYLHPDLTVEWYGTGWERRRR